MLRTRTLMPVQRLTRWRWQGLLSSALLSCSGLSDTAWAGVNISGVSKPVATNIRTLLTITDLPCTTPDWHLQEQRRQLQPQIEAALQPFGYYHSDIAITLSRTDNCWNADLLINPGPQTRLRQLDIQHVDSGSQAGPLPEELRELLQEPPLQAGEPLNHAAYDGYKNELLDTARSAGYWQAQLQRSELAIYPDDHAADVHLHLATGPRYRFGAFRFSNNVLNDDFLQRLTGTIEGQEYSHDTLNNVYKRLQNSDYFDSVVINPQVEPDADTLQIPLNVQLAMRSQHSFSVGTGYSTDQGARVKGTSKNRYLNAAGHKLKTELLWSEREQQLLSAYTIPLQDPTREWLVVEGGYLMEDTDTYRSESLLSGIQHIKVLPYNWLFMSALNVNRENYTIAADEDTTLLVMPELKLSWVTPEKPARMRRGLRFEMRLLASHEAWLSDTNFIQGELLGKYILPVSAKGRLLTRLQAATTLKDDFSELPPSVRLFAGGDTSIRGYEFESVGETDANGEVIGGSHLLVGSLEYDHLIARKWSLSVFTDAGDAFDETFEVKRSVGMGLRWYSPLGPLRVDLAHPLDSDDAFRVHITLGTDL
jgi:translocation and assembly module TamA